MHLDICLLLILPTGSLPIMTTIPSTYICGPIARNVATCDRSASGEIDKDGRLNIWSADSLIEISSGGDKIIFLQDALPFHVKV